jgi:hypothetical protein
LNKKDNNTVLAATEYAQSQFMNNGWGQQSTPAAAYDDGERNVYLQDRDMEKLMFSPDQDLSWVYQSGDSSAGESPQPPRAKIVEVAKKESAKKEGSAKKTKTPGKRGRPSKKEEEVDAASVDEVEKPSAQKQKRKKSESLEQSNAAENTAGSIIKRRRKGELQIVVDGGLGLSMNTNASQTGLNTNTALKATNLHSLSGGGISDMGPPGETPRRSSRLKNGPLSSLSNLNSLGFLESPFNQVLYPDMFGSFGGDTPSRLMQLDPPLSKVLGTGTSTDGVRFDFDEAVAAHFPSPRAGEQLKGSSPYRWSGGSVGSVSSGVFSFPDGAISKTSSQTMSSSTISSDASEALESINIYAKKFKKALKRDSKRDDESADATQEIGHVEEANEKLMGMKAHHVNFSSPAMPDPSMQV